MKKYLYLLIVLCAFSFQLIAQTHEDILKEEIPSEPEIYKIVDQNPEFPGGMDSLFRFLAENIIYPEKAQLRGIQGRVVLMFIVNESGVISNIEVVNDVAGGCSEEAVRVVKKMPKWIPGKEDGKEVKVYYTLPIKFTLQ